MDFANLLLKTLNLHLKTCETYECDTCYHVTKTITEMKKHIRESKQCDSTTIFHIKIDRNYCNKQMLKNINRVKYFEKM